MKLRKKIQIDKTINKIGDITTDATKIYGIMRALWIIICKRRNNLEWIDKFLETYNLPILNNEEIENLNRPIASKENEPEIKNSPAEKTSGPDGFK